MGECFQPQDGGVDSSCSKWTSPEKTHDPLPVGHNARTSRQWTRLHRVSTRLAGVLLVLIACDGGSGTAVEKKDESDGRFQGNFVLENQSDLDRFAEAGYTRIEGDLIINGSSLTDVDGLSTLREVTRSVVISSNSALADVAGLADIESIGDSLIVLSNPVLTALPRFRNLGSAARGVFIARNDALLEIVGFNSLVTTEVVAINFNAALTLVDGFEALTIVDGPSPGTGRGLYQIAVNSSLETIGGFGKLKVVGDFALSVNPMLVSIPEYPALEDIKLHLELYDNQSLGTVRGFEALARIGGGLSITVMPKLNELAGFGVLEEVGRDLSVRGTHLPDLDALRSLSAKLEGNLAVEGNGVLSDITGLNGLGDALGADPIVAGNFSVRGNSALGDSTAHGLLALLEAKYEGSAVAGSVDIGGN